jgi:hypothetical protein
VSKIKLGARNSLPRTPLRRVASSIGTMLSFTSYFYTYFFVTENVTFESGHHMEDTINLNLKETGFICLRTSFRGGYINTVKKLQFHKRPEVLNQLSNFSFSRRTLLNKIIISL